MESKNIMQQNNVSSGSLTDAEKNALSEMVRQLQNSTYDDTVQKQVLPENEERNDIMDNAENKEEMHEIIFDARKELKISEDDFEEEMVSEEDYMEEPRISEDDFE